MAFSTFPESDIPVPHPPNDVRSVENATRFPPPRRWVTPVGYIPPGPTVPTESAYVRRYWVGILGTAALEDLLRLAAAANRESRLRRPTHLHVLITEGLARPLDEATIAVPTRMRLLDGHSLRRLPLPLRSALLGANRPRKGDSPTARSA